MWNCSDVQCQVKRLLEKYSNLVVCTSDNDGITIHGQILIYRQALGFILQQEFTIDIFLPSGDNDLPVVYDSGNTIDSNYPHRYSNGALCLETDTFIKNSFVEGFDLLRWMDDFVEPYFFSYAYYERYGYFPFDERPHGLDGIIDTYKDFFHANDFSQACALFLFAATQKYRGHIKCPCGSEKRLRDCHGPYLLEFYINSVKKAILKNDYHYIVEELRKIESAKTDSRKTK